MGSCGMGSSRGHVCSDCTDLTRHGLGAATLAAAALDLQAVRLTSPVAVDVDVCSTAVCIHARLREDGEGEVVEPAVVDGEPAEVATGGDQWLCSRSGAAVGLTSK